MRKIILISIISIFFISCISGCAKTFIPEDPKTAFEESGFITDSEHWGCSDSQPDCLSYKYEGGSFVVWANVIQTNQIFLGFVIKDLSSKTTIRLQYGLLKLILSKIYPTNVVKAALNAVKNNLSINESIEGFSLKVVCDRWDYEKWNDFKINIIPTN